MMQMSARLTAAVALVLGCSFAAAHAEEPAAAQMSEFDLEEITVEAKRPDWEAKLSPGTVTVIRPDDYKGEQKDLPDLLKMVPGGSFSDTLVKFLINNRKHNG